MSDGKFVDVFGRPEEKRGQGPEFLSTEKVGLGLYRFELEGSHRGSSVDDAPQTGQVIKPQVVESDKFKMFRLGFLIGFLVGLFFTLLLTTSSS